MTLISRLRAELEGAARGLRAELTPDEEAFIKRHEPDQAGRTLFRQNFGVGVAQARIDESLRLLAQIERSTGP